MCSAMAVGFLGSFLTAPGRDAEPLAGGIQEPTKASSSPVVHTSSLQGADVRGLGTTLKTSVSAQERARAAAILARSRGAEGVREIRRIASDARAPAEARAMAIQSLPPPLTADELSLWRDWVLDPAVAEAAVSVLAKAPAPGPASTLLVAVYATAGADLRHQVASALAGRPADAFTEAFFVARLADGDPVVRRVAARTLGGAHSEKSRSALQGALSSDRDIDVRREAAVSLARHTSSEAASALTEAFRAERNPEVRRQLVHSMTVAALHTTGNDDLRTLIASARNDPAVQVRQSAELAVRRLARER